MGQSNTGAWWVFGGTGALALGSFLPWAEVGIFSKNGIDGDGAITLVLAIVIAAVAWPLWKTALGPGRSITVILAATLALIVCIYDIVDISSTGNEFIEASVGVGLWMAAAGAVAVGVGTVIAARAKTMRFTSTGAGKSTSIPLEPRAAPAMEGVNPARWATDPTGRHELRWWDGTTWTEDVSDGGVRSLDAIDPLPDAQADPGT